MPRKPFVESNGSIRPSYYEGNNYEFWNKKFGFWLYFTDLATAWLENSFNLSNFLVYVNINYRMNYVLKRICCIMASIIKYIIIGIITIPKNWTEFNIYHSLRKCLCKWDCINTSKKNEKRIFNIKLFVVQKRADTENVYSRWATHCLIGFNTLFKQ